MSAAATSTQSVRSVGRLAGRARAVLAGIGWQAIAIVVCMALINALRRTIFNIVEHPEEGLPAFAATTATGMLIGSAMMVAVVATLDRFPDRGRGRYAAIAAAVLASSAIAVFFKILLESATGVQDLAPSPHYFLADWLRYAAPGILIAGAYLYFRSETEAAAIAHACVVDSAQMARQVAEARLSALEAQIEPHFLFNTLATVKRLFRTDMSAAERMLDSLMCYLAVALPQMRGNESTLGAEASLAAAYLDIQRIRMGRRLAFTFDIAPALRNARLPPFMLLTLIENAIKHGVNPLREGGTLAVVARSAEGRLTVDVLDTGRGFAQSGGAGTGLANIRARLALLYGAAGSLEFAPNEPHGVVATLIVPLELVEGAP